VLYTQLANALRHTRWGCTNSVREGNRPTCTRSYLCTPTGYARGQYEVGHLIPLELGGSNGMANFLPEAALPRQGFHEQDGVENRLHAEGVLGRDAAGAGAADDRDRLVTGLPLVRFRRADAS
jgi:hypothetical protein